MPQHLQLLDDYHERLLDERLNAIGPNLWGVSELEVDSDELARGLFRVSRCIATMPDGMVVRIGPEQPLKGLLAMTSGRLQGGGQSLEVYLSVPSAEAGGVALDTTVGGTRYVRTSKTVADAFSAAEPVEVECVQPNVQLLVGGENRQNYIALKLAELTINQAGRLAVSDRYIPPIVRVSASRPLMELLQRLVGALASKQKDLVAKYGGRAAAMTEFGAADMATFWYLHTVNSWLPVFMHYSDEGDVHPEQLYLALASFAGQLATFEATTDPLDLPRFRFLDLGSTFFPLFDRLLALLGTVVAARYKTIELEQTQPGLFVGNADPSIVRNHTFFLLAGGDIEEDTLRDDVPRYLKVGSLDQIAQIVQSALPGVSVRIDLSPPSAIPVRSRTIYLRLDRQGRYWDAVKQSGTIAIYQPVKPSSVSLELLAVEG